MAHDHTEAPFDHRMPVGHAPVLWDGAEDDETANILDDVLTWHGE